MVRPASSEVQALSPSDPLPRVLGRWLAFDPRTPAELARRRFRERYGQEPAEVLKAGALLLVGPLPGRRGERNGLGTVIALGRGRQLR